MRFVVPAFTDIFLLAFLYPIFDNLIVWFPAETPRNVFGVVPLGVERVNTSFTISFDK